MKANGRARRIETFQPCGPIAMMIDNATRKQPRGAKRRFIEECIARAAGKRFPKLLKMFRAQVNGRRAA